jgi:hypothetical protein
VEHEERSEKMMNDWCSEIDRNLQDVQTQNRFLICFLIIIKYLLSAIYSRERVSDIMCQVSQFEEQLRDLQHLADTLQPAQAAMKEKLLSMQKNHDVQIASFEENFESLREANAEDNRKLKKGMEEKLFKITRDIGDFDIIERKINALEERLKKLISRIDDSRYEAEVVQRLEISESGMLQKINYCSNQQVYHGYEKYKLLIQNINILGEARELAPAAAERSLGAHGTTAAGASPSRGTDRLQCKK